MESLKWVCYKLLVKFIGQKIDTKSNYDSPIASEKKDFYWLFCSTIGELNGCKPLVVELSKLGQVLLLTDRECYQKVFQQQFPDAIVIVIGGWIGEANNLLSRFNPKMFIACEIPCLPHDAPCRLAYDFLRTLKRAGVSIFVVNGWLYEYAASCRQDYIEKKFFSDDYLRCFDKMMVQNQSVKNKLIALGQEPECIEITGNMKFDAVEDIRANFASPAKNSLIYELINLKRFIFLAGSLSDHSEYKPIIDAFCEIQKVSPDVLMILAPRHPEKPEQIEQISDLLENKQLKSILRSEVCDDFPSDIDVLVLDTFGELQGMYFACNVAYVGTNHNVLEPLAFGKPVFISGNWNSTYPSYPVYELCKEVDLLHELEEFKDIAFHINEINMNNSDRWNSEEIKSKLFSLSGSLEKNLQILDLKPV